MNMRADARSSMQPFDSVCCLAQRIFLGSCHFLGRLGSASFDFVGQLQRPSFPWVLRVHGQRYRTLPHAAPFFITDAPTGRKCAPAPKRTLLRKNTLHDGVSCCAEVGREREKRVGLRNITFGSPFALHGDARDGTTIVVSRPSWVQRYHQHGLRMKTFRPIWRIPRPGE
jgi:hypothetical protein